MFPRCMLWFNFIIGFNFNFPLFWGMVMYDEFEIKENKIIVYFMLLDSPIIGRVTSTAWRQLLLACNSPSPHES